MKTFDQKTVSERFVRLPEGVKDIILSNTTTESIRTLTETAGLEGDRKRVCIEQITLASTGLSTTKDFKTYVTTELHLDPQKEQAFFEGVVQHIFNPIREALLLSLGSSTVATPSNARVSTPGTLDQPFTDSAFSTLPTPQWKKDAIQKIRNEKETTKTEKAIRDLVSGVETQNN